MRLSTIPFWPLICYSTVDAQILEPLPPPNTGYGQYDLITQRVVPYPHIREADVMWHKRIWRDIDNPEKINLPLFYPLEPTDGRSSLFDVIKHALLTDGSITAYSAGVDGWDDGFMHPLAPEEIEGVLIQKERVIRENLAGGVDTLDVITETKSD
ncbi:MAG: hypothetical protein JNM91_05620, partial [Flavobacteriales bacterium]|nr:hypothetical protein [Flavobacteriales bacterium]